MKLNKDLFRNKKIAIVSNRAPVTPVKRDKGIVIERSVGGLVAALEPLIEEFNGVWFCTTNKSSKMTTSSLEKIPYSIHCLELGDNDFEQYYQGYSNKQLWPICHYFPTYCVFNEQDWKTYKAVNEKMANLILENVDEDYFIWIHDYHFMLLPQMLREKNPKLKIGFFLHIPFPNQELFRLLANRSELIQGLLGADLIGLHTKQYVEHFMNCVKILEPLVDKESNKNVFIVNNRKVFVKDFPISIDFDYISNKASSMRVIDEVSKLKTAYQAEIIGVGVDRLDYTKGSIERLLAIEYFFDHYPEYVKKVMFVQVSVPSRTQIESYKRLKRKVDETVGRINGKFAKDGWRPIFYIYGTLSFDDLIAHYALADFALVVPLRDGMNLVAKEYIASKVDNNGVLILSEFAGAGEGCADSLLVNPYQKRLVAEAIKKAVEMTDKEKKLRMHNLREKIKSNNVFNWVNDYFVSFNQAIELNKHMSNVV